MNSPILPDPNVSEEVTPQDVASWLSFEADIRPLLIDCREAEELEICHIDGAKWIPLGDFPSHVEWIREFAERGVLVSCHHGMRSLRATRYLRQQGIERAFSMAGGIDAWSCQIDSSVPRY